MSLQESKNSAGINQKSNISKPNLTNTGLDTHPIIIPESSESKLIFNVLPGKPVQETLYIKEYRIMGNYMEALYDREYVSSMKRSPDHLIFLTALIHIQKMAYVYVCHRFGFTYEPNGVEQAKFWPTKIQVEMNQLVRKNSGLIQKVWFSEIRERYENAYIMDIQSDNEGIIKMSVEMPFFIIGNSSNE